MRNLPVLLRYYNDGDHAIAIVAVCTMDDASSMRDWAAYIGVTDQTMSKTRACAEVARKGIKLDRELGVAITRLSRWNFPWGKYRE